MPIVGDSNAYDIENQNSYNTNNVYEKIFISESGIYTNSSNLYESGHRIINSGLVTNKLGNESNCAGIPCAVQSCEYCRWEYVPGVGVVILYRYCIA
jgi:hypothetical protein